MAGQPSGTVTLVFTDIEGSTRLLAELGVDAYRQAATEHRDRIRRAFARHQGYEVDYEGDAFFYAFHSAGAAVSAVQEATAALADGQIRIRVGVHTGEPALDPPKYVGMDVHRAARIMSCAHGGQIVLSQATRDLLEEQDELRDLGEHRLKDLAAPIRLYQLGDGDYPALRSLYRTNLPVPATVFLGRHRELAEVVALLARDDVRLLTLTGPGGTGKTRLALQAAAEIADGFPDGVWWVPLAPVRDPAHVLPAVAQALGVKQQPGGTLAGTLAEWLADKRLVLVLDNIEQLLPDAAVTIAKMHDVPGPLLVITSRERLHLAAEHLYPVPSLDDADAVALFTARARQVDPAFVETVSAATICEQLDNLPLAIELAAARTSLFRPEQLLERLGRRLDLLKGGRDRDPRQQTLRATIEWSYGLLEPDEQRVFRTLGVFVGGCALEAAEEVGGTDADILQSLLDKSLLRRRDGRAGPRYWMLETIREHALERLSRAEETKDVELRHAAYYRSMAEQLSGRLGDPDQHDVLLMFDDDDANLAAALGRMLDKGTSEDVLRLVVDLARYWRNRDRTHDSVYWLERALKGPPTSDAALREQALRYLGSGLDDLGAHDRALVVQEDALNSARLRGDPTAIAMGLLVLGYSEVALGKPHDALDRWEEGLAVLPEGAPDALRFRLAHSLACVLGDLGDPKRARAMFEEGADYARGAADDHLLSASLSGLGDLSLEEGDFSGAELRFTETLDAARRADQPRLLGYAYAGLAGAAAGAGRAARAGRYWALAELVETRSHVRIPSVERERYERLVEQVAGETFDRAYERARAEAEADAL